MRLACLFVSVIAVSCFDADTAPENPRDFENATVGKLPRGWSTGKTGKGPGSVWKVVEDETAPRGPKVLAQTSSEGPRPLFNLCVAEETNYTDVELTVSFKAVRGQVDRGGGPVWRYQDANNYYICRQNPLENNFRIYKVIGGKRIQLASVDAKAPAGSWHTIRVAMHGEMIVCSINDTQLDVQDGAIRKAGKVGLWTKADAVTYFDDLRIRHFRK